MNRIYTAREIMVAKLVTLKPETSVIDGIRRLLDNRVTGAPVVDRRGRYLGMFSEKCCMDVLVGAARVYTERQGDLPSIRAADIMARNLITLTPDMDVFDAIGLLLDRRISGAPVLDADRRLLGSFSEKTSMSVLLGAAYDSLPGSTVGVFMDRDLGRAIDEDTELLEIAKIFLETHYRRLPVLRDGSVVGQVSRRDVLDAALRMTRQIPDYLAPLRPTDADEPVNNVAQFMDLNAQTIGPDMDLLRIATIFRQTPYRRLTVLEDEQLLGLVSRRDVLCTVRRQIEGGDNKREATVLYFSAVTTREEAPIG